MNLEEIMKPYYDKKENIEKQYIERKSFLTLRLQNLRNNKEREIEEYVQNAVAERPDFYAGYGAMVRKDLEQAYAKKEQELEQEIKDNDKYYRLDVRELVSIKEDLRKELISARKGIELQIQEVKLQMDTIGLQLTRFEPVYDDNYNMLNGEERTNLFNENHRLIEVKFNLEKQLKAIEENLNLTEITKEETSILMMSLTPWEQEELNRRKTAREVENIEVPEIEIPEEENDKSEGVISEDELDTQEDEVLKDEILEEKKSEEEVITDDALIIPEEETYEVVVPPNPVEPDEDFQLITDEEKYEENTVLVDSFKELLDVVFDDVLNSAKKLRSIKLEGTSPVQLSTRGSEDPTYNYAGDLEENAVRLPNGAYLNKRDIFKALDNYRKENKGRIFKVKGYNNTFEINRKTIKLVKDQLRECSAIKLVSEKKLGHFDVKRVYGKEQADKFVELGKVETKMASGEYINFNEFAYNLKDIFAEKGLSWFEKFKNKLTKKMKKQPIEISYNEYEDIEPIKLDDDYVIKK